MALSSACDELPGPWGAPDYRDPAHTRVVPGATGSGASGPSVAAPTGAVAGSENSVDPADAGVGSDGAPPASAGAAENATLGGSSGAGAPLTRFAGGLGGDSVGVADEATGGSGASGTVTDAGGSSVLAGAGGASGGACPGCMPAHCTNGIFESALGELVTDCGGECAQNCRCGDQVQPTLGTLCDTGLGGNCSLGTVVCDSTNVRCAPNFGTAEVCDGIDNDCNGAADYPYETIDADGDLRPACLDSDDADPDNWSTHATCVDRDGDGFYVGCDAYTVRAGPDCNDGNPEPGACAKNVILFIGDGMGHHHVRAGRCFKNGNSEPLVFEALPYRAEMTTFSASSDVTDSAASATAMATGRKANNGVLAMALPGNGADLPSALELRKHRGQATGLVTIHDPITGATPSGFGAHTASRGNSAEILSDYRTGSRPNVLLGDDNGVGATEFADAGYTVIQTEQDLISLDLKSVPFLLGLFPSDVPTLALRTACALELLEQDPDGFFLMVEQSDTDKQSHSNNLPAVVDAVIALDAAVEVALAWASRRTDTLMIVTADHECGGLLCGMGDFESTAVGAVPDCAFTSGAHTGARVPVYAAGVGADQVAGVLDNTDVFALIAGIGP